MADLREIEQDILSTSKVDSAQIERLRQVLYADGKIDRQEADFLVVLLKRVQRPTPHFTKFVYQAIKDHILADGKIDAEEAAWLRQMVLRDGKVQDEERKFLHELKGEAKQAGPEFEALYQEAMKMPPEQRTSGRKE